MLSMKRPIAVGLVLHLDIRMIPKALPDGLCALFRAEEISGALEHVTDGLFRDRHLHAPVGGPHHAVCDEAAGIVIFPDEDLDEDREPCAVQKPDDAVEAGRVRPDPHRFSPQEIAESRKES